MDFGYNLDDRKKDGKSDASKWIKLTGDWKPENTINGVHDEL
jgi:hypothetical protein